MIEFIFASLLFAILISGLWDAVKNLYAYYRIKRYGKMVKLDGPLLVALLFTTGCVTTAPTLTTFPGLDINIIQAEHTDVNRICRGDGGGTSDDGTAITTQTNIAGCWVESERTIYLNYYYEDVTVLLHELCHADGTRDRLECQEKF